MSTEKLKNALRALCAKEKYEIDRFVDELVQARREENPGYSWIVTGLVITISLRENHVAIEPVISNAGLATHDGKATPGPLSPRRKEENWAHDPDWNDHEF
jgi:hypothetical protein